MKIFKHLATILLFPTFIFSNTINNEEAVSISQNWASSHNLNPEIKNVICKMADDEPLLYIFNFEEGWVMISADEYLQPVLGFSFDSNYFEENESDAIKSLFDSYNLAQKENRANDIRFAAEWESIRSGEYGTAKSTEGVEPLVPVTWHQAWPFNAYCPLDDDMPENCNGHHNTSCGPTAFAQILRYWRHPVHGTGYHSYTYDDPGFALLGFVEADYQSTYYNWENMPASLDFDDPEPVYTDIATLMQNIGVSVDGAWSSGAGIHQYTSAAVKYFDYSPSCEVYYWGDFTSEEWHSIFRNELDNGRPIMMAGTHENGGHYFVCDGYYGDDFYHINWGWGPGGSGYYPLYELSYYTVGNWALIGLEPNYQNKNLILSDPYNVDDNTVVLLHFDGDVTNQSTLSGNPTSHGALAFVDNSELGLGQSLYLDNSNQSNRAYLDIADNSNLDLSGDWTIEMWFKPSSFGEYSSERYTLLSKPGDNDNFKSNYSMYIVPTSHWSTPKGLNCSYYPTVPPEDYEAWTSTDRDFLELDNWYHISFIRNSTTNTLKTVIHNSDRELIHYSSKATETASPPLLNSNPLFIGSSNQSNTYFDGYIDELRISNVIREFETTSNEFTLLSPNGGEKWDLGTTQQIRWTCVNIAHLRIEYSADDEQTWHEIISSVAASTGSYTWVLPDINSDKCKVKLTDVTNPDVYIKSRSNFQIGDELLNSVYDIQYTTAPGSDGTYPSLMDGESVKIKGVVTAIGYGGYGNNFFISSTVPEPWRGINIYNADTSPALGDEIKVIGTVEEYSGFTEIINPVCTIVSTDNPVPEPIVVSTGYLKNPINAEQYEDCFVKVENVTVTKAPDFYNQVYINDGSGECQVDDDIFAYSVALGDRFESIVGVVDYKHNEYALLPRFEEDFSVPPVNEAPVISDIPDQTIAEGNSFEAIQLDNLVSDPDNEDSQITWSFSGNDELSVAIDGNRVATISIPDEDWFGSETITFTATDPDGASDSDVAVFTVTGVNDAPLVSNIPDQTIDEGASFTAINLNDFVTDPDNEDSQIAWSFSGNADLSVAIAGNRVATVSTLDENWFGSETITFTAIDPGAASANDQATFTVTSVNDAPVVSDIPNQTIDEGGIFTAINLNDFMTDPDNEDSQISWSFSGNADLSVAIVGNRIATVSTLDENWFGSETITFTATDPGNASCNSDIKFTVNPVNDPPVISGAPEVVEFVSDTSVTIDIWVLISDVESSAELLIYDFYVDSDSILFDFDDTAGMLTLSAELEFGGEGDLVWSVIDIEEIVKDTIHIVVEKSAISAINGEILIPEDFALYQNYPNPFNPVSRIGYDLPINGNVKIMVFDMRGKLIRALVNGTRTAGTHFVTFDGSGLASGIYFYSIEAGTFRKTKKMILIR